LVKICETLDAEVSDARFVALNPGYISTKIVREEKGARTLSSDEYIYRMNRLYNFVDWAIGQEKRIVSGRNFFVEYDNISDERIIRELGEHNEKFKLRRSKDTWNEKEKHFE